MIKHYIGDSVYAALENGSLCLTTENGIPGDPSNCIYLGSQEWSELTRWIETVTGRQKEARDSGPAQSFTEHMSVDDQFTVWFDELSNPARPTLAPTNPVELAQLAWHEAHKRQTTRIKQLEALASMLNCMAAHGTKHTEATRNLYRKYMKDDE